MVVDSDYRIVAALFGRCSAPAWSRSCSAPSTPSCGRLGSRCSGRGRGRGRAVPGRSGRRLHRAGSGRRRAPSEGSGSWWSSTPSCGRTGRGRHLRSLRSWARSQVVVVDSIVRLSTSRWCRPIGRSGQLRVRTGVVVVAGTWSTSRVCGLFLPLEKYLREGTAAVVVDSIVRRTRRGRGCRHSEPFEPWFKWLGTRRGRTGRHLRSWCQVVDSIVRARVAVVVDSIVWSSRCSGSRPIGRSGRAWSRAYSSRACG